MKLFSYNWLERILEFGGGGVVENEELVGKCQPRRVDVRRVVPRVS